jgi:sugar/nucleoside kinase (ribokinase family)
MPGPGIPTALVVGSVTLDLPADADEEAARPGGVVYYAGVALARLGARTRVVTSLLPADAARLLGPLHAESIETAARASRATTSYRNDYSGPEDRHELVASSDPIRAADVPPRWRASDLVQLGPLHRRDVLPEVAAELRGYKGLDVQGLVREARPEGTRISPSADLPRFLPHVDVVKVSEPELAAVLDGDTLERFARRHAVREMLVTRGARGVRVLADGGAWDLPAPVVHARFKVGAGDVFLAAYLFFRVRALGPAEAAAAATQVCAAKLEQGEVPKGFAGG